MKIVEYIRRMALNMRIGRRVGSFSEVASKIEQTSQHYKKVVENCVNYLVSFSGSMKLYRCVKCGKIFCMDDNEMRCPFCNSFYTIYVNTIGFKDYAYSYCSSLYGKSVIFMDVLKDIVKNLCLNRICYFLESMSLLEIFTEKGALRIAFRNEEIIEVELPWVDTSTFEYIDEITAAVFRYREKLLTSGVKFIIYKARYDGVNVDHVMLIRERFIDVQLFKHFIDGLGLSKYVLGRGVLVKIFSIENAEYIAPRAFVGMKITV